ncbi:MAG TPA: VOC family protein [Rhizobiaceae bacterium]|nr:VOC family protein [Rhizobiaceae bacterium]
MARKPRISPAQLDHCVLLVRDLATARARLSALGFTVAPDGVHPFGTANCCVYLADGFFLEPLAVASKAAAAKAMRNENVFVARDRAFRLRNGDNGFSALVVASDDAIADHRRYRKGGWSAGRKLEFARAFTDAQGNSGKASFRLAFCSDPASPDALFFSCERVAVPHVDRTALQRHENGVTGLSQVIVSEEQPARFADVMEYILDTAPVKTDAEIGFDASGVQIRIMKPDTMRNVFAIAREARDRGLRLEGLVFHVSSLAGLAERFKANGVEHSARLGRVIVPAAPGQGAFFVFEEA